MWKHRQGQITEIKNTQQPFKDQKQASSKGGNRGEKNNLWTIEEDKVTMAILKIWEVREANSKVQEANREVHEAKARTRKGV